MLALARFCEHHDHHENPRYSAETGARVLRGATQNWLRQRDTSECPDVSALVRDGELDSATTTDDPWGHPYEIRCAGDEVVVRSAGNDGEMKTEDDLVVPKAAR